MANKRNNIATNTIVSNLSNKDLLFIKSFLESGNRKQAAIDAGYSEVTASQAASRILAKKSVKTEIARQRANLRASSIASSTEILDYLTRVMRGEIKDQFGLDAPLSERTRAAVELAKRTIDIEQKLEAEKNAEVKVVLDWDRKQVGVAINNTKEIANIAE